MGWREATEHLDALGIDAMKSMAPSMHRIAALCEALDHPERAAQALHISGTNGKSSAARIATGLLSAAGLSVGTYTSPHLESVRERIAFNGEALSEEDFGDAFDHVLPYVELVSDRLKERITYFELLTGMFFLWAAESAVDAVVVEVGLGGTWDATNVVTPAVTAITNVGLDHTSLLGTDTPTIAREKAGIIKRNAPVVTGERAPAVLAVIEERAQEEQTEVLTLGRDFDVVDNRVSVGGRVLSLRTTSTLYDELYLPLHGTHQGTNAAVALQAVTSFLPARELGHELVSDGFAQTTAPGRLETIPTGVEAAATVVLDVAHNPSGMSALVSSLVGAFTFQRVVFVVGVLADKDYNGMLGEMTRVLCSVVATQARSARSVPAADLQDACERFGLPCMVVDDVGEAVAAARTEAEPDDLVCITGSHYVVGEARSFLLHR